MCWIPLALTIREPDQGLSGQITGTCIGQSPTLQINHINQSSTSQAPIVAQESNLQIQICVCIRVSYLYTRAQAMTCGLRAHSHPKVVKCSRPLLFRGSRVTPQCRILHLYFQRKLWELRPPLLTSVCEYESSPSVSQDLFFFVEAQLSLGTL